MNMVLQSYLRVEHTLFRIFFFNPHILLGLRKITVSQKNLFEIFCILNCALVMGLAAASLRRADAYEDEVGMVNFHSSGFWSP
jgi:hypothetical protein